MNRDEFYHKYRIKTIKQGDSPIGKRRFNGIIDTIINIEGANEYLSHLEQQEGEECEHDWMYKIMHNHKAADVCTKCGKIELQGKPEGEEKKFRVDIIRKAKNIVDQQEFLAFCKKHKITDNELNPNKYSGKKYAND